MRTVREFRKIHSLFIHVMHVMLQCSVNVVMYCVVIVRVCVGCQVMRV